MKINRFHILSFLLCMAALAAPKSSLSVPTHASAPPPPTNPGSSTSGVDVISHTGGSAQALFVSGSLAYAGFGPELTILDISNPLAPARLGSVNLGALLEEVKVSGSYAYVLLGISGFAVVNVAVPYHPALAGQLSTNYCPRSRPARTRHLLTRVPFSDCGAEHHHQRHQPHLHPGDQSLSHLERGHA